MFRARTILPVMLGLVTAACVSPEPLAPIDAAVPSEPMLARFHGSYDTATGRMAVVMDDAFTRRGPGVMATDVVGLAVGSSGYDDNIGGTGSGSGFCHATGTQKLACGQFTAINGTGADVLGVQAVIDSISESGASADGPYSYGLVGAGSSSNALTWTFSLVNNTSFTFDGHVAKDAFIHATGGTVSTVGNLELHTFTTSGTFTITANGGQLEYLVVGGGGGGAFGIAPVIALATTASPGGGGGGGQAVSSTTNAKIFGVGSTSITVGTGGTGGVVMGLLAAGSGTQSSFDGHVASGGAGASGAKGGTSGGGASGFTPGSFPSVGGGGGGQAMATDGNGAAGTTSPFDMTSYGCGGGGGGTNNAAGGTSSCSGVGGHAGSGQGGVNGGGGGGGSQPPPPAVRPVSMFTGFNGGAGGSGVVIVAFPTSE